MNISTYSMKTISDCGVSAIQFVTKKDYDEVKKAMNFQEYGDFRTDPQDNPYTHLDTINKLGLQWKIRSCGEILSGVATPGKTIILIHFAPNPILMQHWVVLAGVENGMVKLHWGDGKIHQFKSEAFSKLYADGWPACAYEVVETGGQTRLKWWQRLIVYLLGKFI